MIAAPRLRLGNWQPIDGSGKAEALALPAHHLVTHGVVVGMTGSGKTGLLMVTVEEALRSGVPVLAIDVKGDLPNLLLAYPSFAPEPLAPWISGVMSPSEQRPAEEVARALAAERQQTLSAWGIGEPELAAYRAGIDVRVLTPGSSAGEPLHVLSALERRSARWDHDPESARASLSAAVSLVLRLVGRDPDPAGSKEHVLLSVLAERRLRAGEAADLGALLGDLTDSPIDVVGALPLDSFLPKSERRSLAAALNTLLASPTFASWRTGATLDVDAWLTPKDGRTPAVIVSVAHLDDDERALVLGVLLEEVLSWVRAQPGSKRLRSLVVFDEVYGFLPPHPANPPTKHAIVSLMKQARAFGVGVLLATQNPMDLDYRALSNAGMWCVGRLQTDADRERVVEGLAGETRGKEQASAKALGNVAKKLAPRWFVLRDAQAQIGPVLLQPRYAISFLRGPMTRTELVAARSAFAGLAAPPCERSSDVGPDRTGLKRTNEGGIATET
ncbi:putative ATP-binding protein [Labilithrix luteola]|uniref:Putative ATP-binding protein n=1 Tax=Labilithrix luteola TaxID=1391654 RepID=A0A0K1Q0I8_9BACT|nr:helicase HerA-like domain-containing protein [Labilithrix luteola]AKU99247.1 putative ATP-binding protein [Labilithrix luteola]